MENTRTFKDNEVPHEAVESVNEMIDEMVGGIVTDFCDQLSKSGKTLEPDGINMLTGVVKNQAKITLKMALKVDIDLVGNLQIPIHDINQASIESFNGLGDTND